MNNYAAVVAFCVALSGCTQFDTSNRQQKEWQVRLEAPEVGGCYLSVDVRADDEITDDTVDFQHPAK